MILAETLLLETSVFGVETFYLKFVQILIAWFSSIPAEEINACGREEKLKMLGRIFWPSEDEVKVEKTTYWVL